MDSLHRLSIAQYHAMIREGILTDEDDLELLDGLLVCKLSKNPPHNVATELLQRPCLASRIQTYWIINLVARCVEVYTDPTGPTSQPTRKPDYRKVQTFGPDDPLAVILEGREVGRIIVREILP